MDYRGWSAACQEHRPHTHTLFNFSVSQGKHGVRGQLSVLCVNVLEYTQRRGQGGGGRGGGADCGFLIWYIIIQKNTQLVYVHWTMTKAAYWFTQGDRKFTSLFSLWASAENIYFTFWKYNANALTSSCFQISTDHIACTFFCLFLKVYTLDTAPPSARTQYCTLTLQVLHQSDLSSWEGEKSDTFWTKVFKKKTKNKIKINEKVTHFERWGPLWSN